MVIMSVDYGDVRTGLAVCDKNEILASPVCVIKDSDRISLIDSIIFAAKERKVEAFVVGLPKNMDGTEGFRAEACRSFAEALSEKSGLEAAMYDERLTTVSAHNALNLTDTRGKKRKAVVDAVSAVMILEDYLAHRRNTKIDEI